MPADKGEKLVAKLNKSRKQRLRQHSPPGRREKAPEMRMTTCPEESERRRQRKLVAVLVRSWISPFVDNVCT